MLATTTLPDDLLGCRAAGKLINIHGRTVYRWIRRGRLRGWRVGHVWRVRRADLLALVEVSEPAPEVVAREERERELALVDEVLRREGVRR